MARAYQEEDKIQEKFEFFLEQRSPIDLDGLSRRDSIKLLKAITQQLEKEGSQNTFLLPL